MAKYSITKAKINEKITTNTTQAITGNVLNEVLQTMVESLGADYQFGGLVQPGSTFTAGEQPVVFLATTPGTYTNFGGLVVADGEVALLVWSGTAWSKQTPDIATRTEVSQLGQDVAEGFVVRPVQTTENLLDTFDIYKLRPGVTYNNGEIIGTSLAFKKDEEAIPLNCEPGRYVISCKAYCEGNVTTSSDGFTIRVFYTDETYENPSSAVLPNSADTWTELYIFTNNDKTVSHIVFKYSSGGKNITHIKEFQIRKSNVILDYIPSKSAYDANAQIAADAQKAKIGYYVCNSVAVTSAKIVDAPGYKLETGASIKIKFANSNTQANCTLNINNTGAKPLKLDGENISYYDNNYSEGTVVEVYYDGEYYQAKTIERGISIDVYSIANQMNCDSPYNNFFHNSYTEVSENSRKMTLAIISPTRLSPVYPFPSCELVMSGNVTNAGLGCFVVDDIISYNNKNIHYSARTISGLEGYSFNTEYDSVSDTTKITIKCKKPVIFTLRNAVDGTTAITSSVVSYTRTSANYALEEEIGHVNSGVAGISGMIINNLTLGGYSSVSAEQTVSSVESNNRISTLYPVKSGTFKFRGHLKWVASPGVDKNVEFSNNKRVYHVVNGVLKQRSVEYDSVNDITTLSFVAVAPILPVFGKIDNTAFDSIDFISFEESDKAQTFNIPLKFTNPFNGSVDITCFSEPTIVVADDGTIIIASTCGESSAYESNMISVSHDGGKTWTSTLNEGESIGWQQMVWDKQNHRLVALKGRNAYYSEDYGTTWTLLAEDIHDNEIYPNQGGTTPNTVSQEMKALVDYYNSLDDGFEYSAEWTQYRSPGVQLANGVVAFARGTSLKKKNPDTHAEVSMITSQSFVVYSKDYGQTWETPVFLPLYRSVGGEDVIVTTNENCICEALPNQICINSRGGTEAAYGEVVNVRRIFFQHTPVSERSQFAIDSWDADYDTRPSNTISDSIVNAGLAKISGYVPQGSSVSPINFWLFANIDNPNGTARSTQMLRLSADCHNWVNVCVLSPNNDYIKGYIGIESNGHEIYIVMEGNRNEPLRFMVLDYYMLGELLTAYETANKYFPITKPLTD